MVGVSKKMRELSAQKKSLQYLATTFLILVAPWYFNIALVSALESPAKLSLPLRSKIQNRTSITKSPLVVLRRYLEESNTDDDSESIENFEKPNERIETSGDIFVGSFGLCLLFLFSFLVCV